MPAPTPRTSRPLDAADLAVVINTADPLSVAIGNYYVRARRIARKNVARVSFGYERDDLPEKEFIAVKAAVERQVGPRIQAYALTWARPYRVDCVSITYAFAVGPNKDLCARGGCTATPLNPYFDASTSRPFKDLHIRPAMSIAALDFKHAKELIDRGVSADGIAPRGTAYLVWTSDPPRNVRSAEYPGSVAMSHYLARSLTLRGVLRPTRPRLPARTSRARVAG
jgi:uncharacterized protein (TIGR03790 family)